MRLTLAASRIAFWNHRNYVLLVVCLILGASPLLNFAWSEHISPHDRQRILATLCLIAAGTLFISHLVRKPYSYLPLSNPVGCSLGIFFILGLTSSLFAASPLHALTEWTGFILLLVLIWVIASAVEKGEGKVLDLLLLACGVGCGIYLLNAILIYLAMLTAGAQPKPLDLITGFSNYRFFNHIQTVSLPLLALLVLRSRVAPKQYWFWYGVLSLWWTLLFVSAGRGTFAGLLIGVIASAWILGQRARGWVRLMAATCLIGFLFYALFYLAIPSLLDMQPFGTGHRVVKRTVENFTSGRMELWKMSWTLIRENPLLGAGPLHFAKYGKDLYLGAHPHNWILQIAAEWGLPALAALIFAIARAFAALLNTVTTIKADDTANLGALAAWVTTGVAILVDGLFSGLIVMPASQLWIALYVGCAAGWAANFTTLDKQSSSLLVSRKNRLLFAALITAVLIAFSVALVPRIIELLKGEVHYSIYGDDTRLRPRIWLQGYF